MRRGGTRNARASAVWLRPNGRRNSSRRISPGVGLGSNSRSVVVDDLDIGRTSFPPDEADAPLVIGAYRILSRSFPLQCLEPIAGRNAQIRKRSRLVEQTQLSQRDCLHV